jgi:ATP-binding cassette, subfamily C (CFTR/MRP), member 1
MVALFKMIDLSGSGSISIDDIDIASIPSGVLRSALNAVPQEPFFLAGSVRLNIDPYGSSTDEQVLEALSKVQLRSVIEDKGGLDADLEKDSLSHGQRQLFCLARAILRQSKIVVLDEITSR